MRAPLFLALGCLVSTLSGCSKLNARELVREGNVDYSNALYTEAIAKYDEAEKLEPDGVTVYWNRACAAESIVLRLKDDENGAADRKRYADLALADFQRWADRTPEMLPEQKKQLEEHRLAILSADSRCPDLIAFWTERLRSNPTEESLYSTIARTYDEVCNDKAKADEWYKKRTEDFKDSASAWYALGVRMFDPLMPTPDSGLMYNSAMSASERVAQANEVIRILNQATSLRPKYRDPFTWRALAYTQRRLARQFGDPPADDKEKLEALLAREDSLLAWKEQRAVCDIDSIPDCPLEKTPAEIFAAPGAVAGKDVNLAGKIVADSIKTVEGSPRTYSFDLEVSLVTEVAEEAEAAPAKGKKPAAPVKKQKKSEIRKISVTYKLLPPQKGEDDQPVDDSETLASMVEGWKAGDKETFVGQLSADGKTFVVEQRASPACCPPAPISPEEVATDAAMKAKLLEDIARADAGASAKNRRRGRG